MRLRRIIIGFFVLLVLVVGGAGLWLWNTDLGRFDQRIETLVSDALGRELKTGELSLRLGRIIRLQASVATLANPDWAPEPTLLRVGKLEAEVVLSSLFDDGPIRIHRLVADDIELKAFRDEDGRHSFQFQAGADAGASERQRDVQDEPPADAQSPFPVHIRDGRLSDARLQYVDASRDQPMTATVASLQLVESSDAMLDIELIGDLAAQPMRFDGVLGPTDAFLNGGPLSFDADGVFGSLSVEGKGQLDDLFAVDRPAFNLRVHGPDIRDVERLLGLEPGDVGAYDLRFEGTPDGDRLKINLDGEIGEFRIDFTSEGRGLQSMDDVIIDLHVRGPNLQNVTRLFGLRNVPAEPFEALGVVRRSGVSLAFDNVSSVIGDTVFDLNGDIQDFTNFRDSRLRLDISGPDIARFRNLIGAPGLAEGPFSVFAELEPTPQGLGIVQGRIQSTLGNVQLSGTIGDQPGYVGTEATVSISGPDARLVLDALGIEGFRPEPFDLTGEIAIEDDAVHLRTATLDGLLGTRVVANGRIGFDFFSPATALDLQVSGPDIGTTLRYHAEALPPWQGAFDVRTRLRATHAGLRFDAVEATIAEGTLQGDALIPLSEDLDGLDVTFEATGQNLARLLKDTVAMEVPAVDWTAAGHVRRVNDSLLLDDLDIRIAKMTLAGKVNLPWPMNDLGKGEFQLQAKGPDLSRVLPRVDRFSPSAVPFDVSVAGDLAEGNWTFAPSWVYVGEARLELEGTFSDLPDFSATDITVSARLPDLSRLGSWEQEDLPTVPLELSLQMTGARKDLVIDNLDATIGASRVEGRIRYSSDAARKFYGIDLTSDQVDLRPLLPEPEAPSVNLPTPAEEASSPDRTARMIPDYPLPFELLARQDVDLDVQIGEFQTHKRIVSDIDIKATVSDGALTIDRYRSRGLAGAVRASGSLLPRGDGNADMTLAIDATDLVPIREAWLNADPATLPQVNASARLTGVGSDLRSLAGSLNGGALFFATEGILPGEGLSALHLGITDIVLNAASLNDEARRPTTLTCFAGRIQATDGVLTTEPIGALRTDRLLVMASGSINLNDERLNLGFEIIPSRMLGLNLAELANSLLRIRGTLARPTAEIDPTGTLVYGGAAVATGGLSILARGLWDRLRRSSAPCDRLRQEVMEEGRQALESFAN